MFKVESRQIVSLILVSLILILLSVSIISVAFSNELSDYFLINTSYSLQEFAIYALFVILLLQLFIFFRRSKEATRELREIADIASEISPDVLLTTNKKGKIEFIARSVKATFGYISESLVGKTTDILFEIDPTMKFQPSPEIIEGSGFKIEFGRGKTDCGKTIILEIISKTPRKGTHTIYLLRDISRRIEIQKEIDTYQNKLRALWSHLSLAEERERQRISANLHDKIGQYLALAKIKLGALISSIDDPERKAEADDIRSLVSESILHARSLMFEMNKPLLFEISLTETLRTLCMNFRKEHNFFCTFEDDGRPKPLGDDLSVVIYQAARELLLNVKKHAYAERATVMFLRDGDDVKLIIEDDGCGFDVESAKFRNGSAKGFGLFSISERIEFYGGKIEIVSKPQSGTKVEVTVPIKNREEIS